MIEITQFVRRPRQSSFSLERLFEDLRHAMPRDCSIRVHVCRNFSTGIAPRLQDMWLARRRQGQVNHITGDVHFLAIALCGKRTILTVHDLVLLKRLRGVRRWIIWFAWYWWPLRRCAAIVVISEQTRRDLLDNIPCDPSKVFVIRNAVSSEFVHSPCDFNQGKPRILVVGTGWNKNLELVAKAVADISCQLVIIGALSEGQSALLSSLRLDYENHVSLTRMELLSQYQSSDMLVFASTFEGFGLPIVEAQAVGRPVVTSDLEPMKEVAGPGACLVDPDKCLSIRQGVLRVINNKEFRDQLIARGLENVTRFRSNKVAEQYAMLYRQVADSQ